MTTINFPRNVKGLDWTQPAMEGPPAERTQVGYFCWVDYRMDGETEVPVDCQDEFFVLPDGGAEIVQHRDNMVREVKRLSPGTWEPEYPTTTFGSRGGIWIKKRN